MPGHFSVPPVWGAPALLQAIADSTGNFRQERFEEPLDLYAELFETYRGVVDEVLELTLDLRDLRAQGREVCMNASYLEVLRFVAGPFVSVDDLKVIAETSLSLAAFRRDPEACTRVVESALNCLDRGRFPWVFEEREPTEAEKGAATIATATLMATERVKTLRRNRAKKAQEDAVAAALLGAGFVRVGAPAEIRTLEDAPKAGQFCTEVKFGGRKADLVVGLWDRRRMALECKVSNSGTNSVKRVNNDAAVKAGTWNKQFGLGQVVPAAVLSGVFTRRQLENAQTDGLTLFWAHRLDDLVDWVDGTRP